MNTRASLRSSQAAQQDSTESIPEWGDPSVYPAGYDGFVSFHPPGSEGWPSPQLAYLRPWPPPGATSETTSWSNSAWPIVNGPFADTSFRSKGTAYPLTNMPLFDKNGASRPGPIVGPGPWQHIPRSMIDSGKYDYFGATEVDLRPELFYDPYDPNPSLDFSTESADFPSPYEDDTWCDMTTVPPCKWMILEHPRYPWKITVTAKVPRQGCVAGVTVRDVLKALHEDFRKEVKPFQAYSVDGFEDALQRQHTANLTHNGSYASWMGLQRLHWLGTRRIRFLGLTPHHEDPSRWTMHFAHDSLPEKPLPPIPPPTILDHGYDDMPPPAYSSGEDEYPDTIIYVERDGRIRAVQPHACRNLSQRQQRYSRKGRVVYQPVNVTTWSRRPGEHAPLLI